jgi:hypothetical protein
MKRRAEAEEAWTAFDAFSYSYKYMVNKQASNTYVPNNWLGENHRPFQLGTRSYTVVHSRQTF